MEKTMLSVKAWAAIIGIAVTAALAAIGAGAWMYGNLDHRLDRFEDAAKSDHKDVTAALTDIRVQLATIAARPPAMPPKEP